MRVMLFTNVFPNPVSPTKGTFNRQLARALAETNDVRAIVPVSWVDELRGKQAKRRDTVDGIDVRYPRFIYVPKLAREYFDWWMHASTRGTAEALFREWRPEAIVAYWAHPDGAVATRFAHKLGVPVVIMVGGTDINNLMQGDARRRVKILKALNDADAVVTVSRDLLATLLKAGLRPETLHVIDRGVDSTKFSPANRAEARKRLGLEVDGRLIVWVGRMVPVKRLDILLEAAAILRDRGVPPFRIQLVGDGELRKSLIAQVHTLGLEAIVGFAGSKPHDALPDYYRAADVTVLPSENEGIPNVLRESLASGTPFVASRVGGIPELFAGVEDRCRLVPRHDPHALADSLAEVMAAADPHPTEALGSSQSWGESALALMNLVTSLVDAKRAQPSVVAQS